MFQPIEKEKILAAGGMCFDTVQEGMERYVCALLSGSEEDLYAFLNVMMCENEGASFADFYYGELEPDGKERFLAGLSETEKTVLAGFALEKGKVYYPLTSENAGFLFGLTVRNWLFSTFYFTHKKAVLWGNYDKTFPLFCETEEQLEEYAAAAEDKGLNVYRI